MQRIEGAGHLGNRFVAEDVGANRPPTEITAEWLNGVQEELASLVEWAGLALDRADNTQVRRALLEKFALASALVAYPLQVNTWAKAQRGAVVALVDAATITLDLSLANNFEVTLGGNRTLGTPANAVAGQSGVIVVKQDAVGGRALAFGQGWVSSGGVVPALSVAAGAVDFLTYYVESPGRIGIFLGAKGVV